MIIKSFNLNDLKKNNSIFYLFYGENEGHKEEAINNYFLKNFKGEIIKYDENQILENSEVKIIPATTMQDAADKVVDAALN